MRNGLRKIQRFLILISICFIAIFMPSYASAQTTALVSPVAVVPLQNLSPENEWAWMSQAIGDTIVTKLSKVRGLQVLERAQVEKALEELGLPLGGVVDNETAPQVGRFVGARGIILGSYIVTKDNFLRISVRLINVESSEVLAGEQVTSEIRNAGDIFRAIDQLAFGLLETMGYELTEQEKQKVTATPTESIPALEAKTKAQTELGKGKEEEALKHVNQALKDDPGYGEAKDLKRYLLTKQGRWFFTLVEISASSLGLDLGLWNPAAVEDIVAPYVLFRTKVTSQAITGNDYYVSLTYVEQVLRTNMSLSISKAHQDREDYEWDLIRLTLGAPLPISERLTLGASWSYAHIENHTDTGIKVSLSDYHMLEAAMQYATGSLSIQATATALYYGCWWESRAGIGTPEGCALRVMPLWEGLIRFKFSDGLFFQVGNVSIDSRPILQLPYIGCLFVITPNIAVHVQVQVRFTGVDYSLGGVLAVGNIGLGVLYRARASSVIASMSIGF